jgi:single-strand DNA-binding protein
MAILSGIFRVGRDAELRYTTSGDAVLSIAVVYNYGRKKEDGNRPSQWVDVALWGKRATSLQPYITKGSQISLVIQDPHIETYQTKDGREGHRFTGQILDVELIGGSQNRPPEAKSAPSQSSNRQAKDDDFFDTSIPF